MHCHEKYELVELSTTHYTSSIRNILARIKSLLLHGFKSEMTLPKVCVFVLDDDVLKQTALNLSEARSGRFSTIVKYLMEEVHHMMTLYSELLPKKTKREFLPHIIWILPPTHKYFPNNLLRDHFVDAMEATVQSYNDMCAL